MSKVINPNPVWQIGMLVTYRCIIAPGGYSYGYLVDGMITRIGLKRIEIEILKADGKPVRRWVSAVRLSERKVLK